MLSLPDVILDKRKGITQDYGLTYLIKDPRKTIICDSHHMRPDATLFKEIRERVYGLIKSAR